MFQVTARALTNLVSAHNPRTVCPPGSLSATVSPLPLVVVAALPASGAQLLIDFILNNFPAYRRSPLYVDLDSYIHAGLPVEELLRVGGYVLKTHHPEAPFSSLHHEVYEAILQKSILITPTRSPASIARAYHRMFDRKRQEDLPRALDAFNAFWTTRPREIFAYGELTDPANAASLVCSLECILNLKPRKRTVAPPTKKHGLSVSLRQLATRLLGNKLSIVNTAVGSTRSK